MRRGKHSGNKGQGSKWLTKKKRAAIYARDHYECVWCGTKASPARVLPEDGVAPGEVLTIDHLIPRSRGGTNEANNLVTSCMSCNILRGDAEIWSMFCKAEQKAVKELSARLVRALDGSHNIPGFKQYRRKRPKKKKKPELRVVPTPAVA